MTLAAIRADLVLDTAPIHAEGPWWDARIGQLWWVDILGMKIHRSEAKSGADSQWTVPEHIGAVVGRSSGGVVALLRSGFAAVSETGDLAWIARVEADDPGTRFNDGKCDPSGRVVGGTLSYQKTPGAGSLYRLEVDHSVTRLVAGLTLSNGLAWSANGRIMYLIDSASRSLHVYAYDENECRHLDERSLGPGVPDGMTIDGEGCLWVAMYGAGLVQRFMPDGRRDIQAVLPVTGVTSCMFGGRDLDLLYITTSSYGLSEDERRIQPGAGGIFACNPGVTGRPEPLFTG